MPKKQKKAAPKPFRSVVAGARGLLAGKVIGRPKKGTKVCFRCKDLTPNGEWDPLISKVNTVKKYSAGIVDDADFANAVGHRICRRNTCFHWYTPLNQVRRYGYRRLVHMRS